MIVGGPVASVELVLDGQAVGVVRKPSWSAEVDLGEEILPHELVARALSEKGEEVSRTRQWLNLPRPPAEVEVLLEKTKDGRAAGARLSWQSLTGEEPKRVQASLNGKPLTVAAQHRAAIPAYDPEQVQLLTVELEFDRGVRARKDVVFGGRTGAEAGKELTAVPIRMRPGDKTPAVSQLNGLLHGGLGELAVAAVEEGPGLLLFVRDSSRLDKLGGWDRHRPMSQFRSDVSLDGNSVMRFLWPRPAAYSGNGTRVELFPLSQEIESSQAGLRSLLTRLSDPEPERRPARFTDAVAVAGLNAYGTFGRRAVLMVIEPGTIDTSEYTPEIARRFLASLHVPLYVWSVGPLPRAFAGWSEAVDVSSEKSFKESAKKIGADLESQRIVWVDGKLLPQSIDLVPGAAGIELVH